MKENIKEIIALASIILTLIGLPALIIYYEKISIPSKYGEGVRIINLSATAPKTGCLWTLGDVVGYNYWWKKFKFANEIKVKQGDTVIFRIKSADVLHSFAIPQFRIGPYEVDAGKVKEVEFIAENEGNFKYLCWLWCSDCHADLTGKVVVEGEEGL